MSPAEPMRPRRTPRSSDNGNAGTFRLKTVRGGASNKTGNTVTAKEDAVSHGWGSAPVLSDTANAFRPIWAAVSAAPTVPECRTDRPTFTPRLIPETTRSGVGPNAPNLPTIVESAGDASSPNAGTPSAPSILTLL